ncbi:MAG: glycosyltransferase [Bacteroidetes bacterium]|nr:glycosyltransferase [Bacteroidota bacterium]
MKILFLTPRIPFPPYRGDKLKIYNLIKNLSKSNEIVLVSFVERQIEFEYKKDLLKYCKRVELIYLPKWLSVLKSILVLISNYPFQIKYYSSRKMKNLVNDIVNEEKPDVVHTHLLRMAEYTKAIPHKKRILDITDASSLYLDRFQKQTKNIFIKIFIKWEKNKMIKYENTILNYDKVLVCSSVDKNYLLNRIPNANIYITPNGIDLEVFKKSKTPKIKNSIIFTGNMSYFPNMDAVEYFVKDIFPKILSVIGDATFYIVGQNPSYKIKNLATSNIIVTGFVKDIKSEYLKSEVAVSPIRFGAGTLNKILEPLSLGIPVVATSIGSEGFNLVNGKEIIITDNSQEMSDSIIKILKNKKYRDDLGTQAEKKVRKLYDWKKISTDLINIYNN